MRVTFAAVAVLAAVTVAGCSPATISRAIESAHNNPAAPTTIVAQPAAQGVDGESTQIPWSQVGPGWVLATWNPVPGRSPGEEPAPGEPSPETATTTLYLVDPAGVRYPITTFAPDQNGYLRMLDWSGDGSRALFYRSGPGSSTSLIEIDLHSGTQTTIPVDSSSPQYTLPQGKALLVATEPSGSKPASLVRVDLSGNQQLTYPVGPDFKGNFLSTPDGTNLVLDTRGGLALMGNDGKPGKTLPVAGQTHCEPLRWWDTGTTVVASCSGAKDAWQLWLVPVDGGAPKPLTAPNKGQTGPDYRDLNAWNLPSGTFVQAAGACGVIFLAKVNPDGTTSPVSVPNVEGKTIRVLGVNGDNLQLQAKAACGGGQALVNYNPATGTSTVLLGASANGGSVVAALAYPGRG